MPFKHLLFASTQTEHILPHREIFITSECHTLERNGSGVHKIWGGLSLEIVMFVPIMLFPSDGPKMRSFPVLALFANGYIRTTAVSISSLKTWHLIKKQTSSTATQLKSGEMHIYYNQRWDHWSIPDNASLCSSIPLITVWNEKAYCNHADPHSLKH